MHPFLRIPTARLRRYLAVVLLGGAVIPLASAAGAHAASTETWDQVAQCESTGDWHIDTGNGFFGGLQFTPATWAEFGGTQYAASADQATREQQITIAEKVLKVQGPGAWPVCSVRAGLTAGGDAPDLTGANHPSAVMPDAQNLESIPQINIDTPTPAPDAASDSSAPAATGVGDVFTAPVAGSVTTAYRTPGSMWSSGYHTGIDFPVPTGTPIKAIGAGQVVSAGWGGAYGNQVVIQHADGTHSQYAHLSQLAVQAGQQVTPGTQIGLSGTTGNSSGPHLHFEIRTGPDYGSDIDPVAYLRTHGVSLHTS